jgi:choline kinase
MNGMKKTQQRNHRRIQKLVEDFDDILGKSGSIIILVGSIIFTKDCFNHVVEKQNKAIYTFRRYSYPGSDEQVRQNKS